MELRTHGARKYSTSDLLCSSAGLGWPTLSAELRRHGISDGGHPQRVSQLSQSVGHQRWLLRRHPPHHLVLDPVTVGVLGEGRTQPRSGLRQ